MKTPILGQSYITPVLNIAANRCVNLYPETIIEGGNQAAALKGVAGLTLLATLGAGPVRGQWVMQDALYVVSGASLYRVNRDWTYLVLGAVTGTGKVSMADNGYQLFIATNPDGFIYNVRTDVFEQITDPDFPGAVTVAYLDGFFIFNRPNSQELFSTALLDGADINGLDYTSAESVPDNVIGVMKTNRELWAFGAQTAEPYYNAALIQFPLEPVSGAQNETGLAGPFGMCRAGNTIYWIAADERGQGHVMRANGYAAEPVSTFAVAQVMRNRDLSTATLFSYQQDGHEYIVLSYDENETTWVYDLSVSAWHERGEYRGRVLGRYRVDSHAYAYNTNVGGDYKNGNLYRIDPASNKYHDTFRPAIRAWRAAPATDRPYDQIRQHSLNVQMQSGVGLTAGANDASSHIILRDLNRVVLRDGHHVVTADRGPNDDAFPVMSLRWSDDGGNTWSSYHVASMGRIGQTGLRVDWRRLGAMKALRDRVYEVSTSANVPISITDADIGASPARS
jgi:hypothetical protein